MTKGNYKMVLLAIFDILQFSDEEKNQALDDFKKKLAAELMDETKNSLPKSQQEWILNNSASAKRNDPAVKEVQEAIAKHYPAEIMRLKIEQTFRRILKEYIDFISRDLRLDQQTLARLENVIRQVD